MLDYEVLQLILFALREVSVGSTCIGEVRPRSASDRVPVRQQEGVFGPLLVIGRVGVPKRIPLAVLPSTLARTHERAVEVDAVLRSVAEERLLGNRTRLLSHVPQIGLPYSIVLSAVKERVNLKFLPKLLGKGNVSFVIQACVAED